MTEQTANDTKELSQSEALVAAMNDQFQNFRHGGMFNAAAADITERTKKILHTREKYFNELARYRYNWVTRGIYDIVVNDVIQHTDDGGIMVTVKNHPELTEELNELFSDINLTETLQAVLPEMLHYGSYPLRPVVEEDIGLIGLIDDLDPKDVIAITDTLNNPLFYFINYANQDQSTLDYGKRIKMEYAAENEVAYLSLDMTFVKLGIPEKVFQMMKKKLADVYGEESDVTKLMGRALKIRSSCGFMWGVLDKLKNTLLMDKIGVYKSIANLITPTVIGVPLPNTFDPKSMTEVIQKYDEMINSSSVNSLNPDSLNFNIQDISSVKVIPVASEKGSPQVLDTGKSGNEVDPEKIKGSLESLLHCLGIPLALFMGDQSDKDNLKTNIRYAKNIKRIKRSLSKFIQHLALLHIAYRFPDLDINRSEIIVNIKSNINTDELENLETQDLIISSTTQVLTLIDTMRSLTAGTEYTVDNNELIKTFVSTLEAIGSPYQKVFKVGGPNDSPKAEGTTNEQTSSGSATSS